MDKFNLKPKHPKNKNFVMVDKDFISSEKFPGLSGNACKIFLVITLFANYESRNARLSNNKFKQMTGLDIKTIIKAKKELEAAGFLKSWQSQMSTAKHFNISKVAKITENSTTPKVTKNWVSYPKPHFEGTGKNGGGYTQNLDIGTGKNGNLNRVTEIEYQKEKSQVSQFSSFPDQSHQNKNQEQKLFEPMPKPDDKSHLSSPCCAAQVAEISFRPGDYRCTKCKEMIHPDSWAEPTKKTTELSEPKNQDQVTVVNTQTITGTSKALKSLNLFSDTTLLTYAKTMSMEKLVSFLEKQNYDTAELKDRISNLKVV